MLPIFILTHTCFEKHYSRKYCGHPWLTDTVTSLVIGSSCGTSLVLWILRHDVIMRVRAVHFMMCATLYLILER
jgi:hypothetical protein